MTSPTTWQGRNSTTACLAGGLALNRALRPLMSGVRSRETGLDSLFASKPVGPGFEPCLGQAANLAGAPKPLCLCSICYIYSYIPPHSTEMRLLTKLKALV